MQTDNNIPDTNQVSRLVLQLLVVKIMVLVMLLPMLNVLYFDRSVGPVAQSV